MNVKGSVYRADIFDRFRPPDEPAIVANCAQCGGEIYAGDEVKRTPDGETLHNGYGYDCAKEYADLRTFNAMGTINIRGEID